MWRFTSTNTVTITQKEHEMSELCYVCNKEIHTEHETDFSSTRKRGTLQFFHIGCAKEDDPKTYDEFIEEEKLYLLSVA